MGSVRRFPQAWFVALASCVTPLPPSSDGRVTDTDAQVTETDGVSGEGLPWQDDPCVGLPSVAEDFYGPTVARWGGQDDAAPPPSGQLVAVGSSSIRRWEGAFGALAPWGVVQRGFGGAQMYQVAGFATELVTRHRPSGVVVFAGTNDIAFGVDPEVVVQGWRCLVQRVFDAQGPTPMIYVGITPTPSRWALWAQAEAVNTEIARLAGRHPMLGYVDLSTPFLATGSPPRDDLFVDDRLHLSDPGYALWTAAVLPVVEGLVARRDTARGGMSPGTLVRVDLGPSNAEDGEAAPRIDTLGIHWNAWHPVMGGEQVLAGEALRGLVSTTGTPTGVDLVITGGFRANGRRNGGLASPDGARLGTLALPQATGDFFFTEGADDPAGLAFTGLDPDVTYTLRLFASRADPERRVTRYAVEGAGPQGFQDLVTSGAGVGSADLQANDDTVVVFSGLAPDVWGQLLVDVRVQEGRFAYLSLVELEAEAP